MLPLARLEGEPKSGAIYAHLFISATPRNVFPSNNKEKTIVCQIIISLYYVYQTVNFNRVQLFCLLSRWNGPDIMAFNGFS